MTIQEILNLVISDIKDNEATNNKSLEEILKIEEYLRDCIRHLYSFYLEGLNKLHPYTLPENEYDVNYVFMDNEGIIWFNMILDGTIENIEFDDIPIETLIGILKIIENLWQQHL